MDKNKKNLPKEYWDDLDSQYPGYVEHFIQWAEDRLLEADLTCVDHFYRFPLSMQLGLFFEYLSFQHCEFEVIVTDMNECVEQMEEYFADVRYNDLHLKQMFKNGEI